MTERIAPTSDLGFKKICSSPESKDVLRGIIGDFFNLWIPLEEIHITAPYNIRSYEEYVKRLNKGEKITEKLRQTVQDVVADIKIADFAAEAQIRKDWYFSLRAIYYACARFCSNYSVQGKMVTMYDGTTLRYSSLKPVYCVNILGYPHFTEDDDALRILGFYDRKRHKSFDRDYLLIAFFELTKNAIETENQRHWKTFLQTGEAPADAPEYIKKAAHFIEIANLTQEERDMYNQVQRAKDIYDSERYTAQIEGERIGEARGEARGEDRGRKEKALAIARKMLNRGRPIEEIAEDTGLTIDEIRKLMH